MLTKPRRVARKRRLRVPSAQSALGKQRSIHIIIIYFFIFSYFNYNFILILILNLILISITNYSIVFIYMRVHVHLKEKVVTIQYAEGVQLLRWLGHVAILRYDTSGTMELGISLLLHSLLFIYLYFIYILFIFYLLLWLRSCNSPP